MIYLNAEVVSGLGEDTFWTWFKREFPTSSFDLPPYLKQGDLVLQYSTLGPYTRGRYVALMWELHPEMKAVFGSDEWDPVIRKIQACGALAYHRALASNSMISYYEHLGPYSVLPIGVDTDLFRPLVSLKPLLRSKYQLPQNKTIGIWVGTSHRMKGFEKVLQYSHDHPDIYWIIVWKQAQGAVGVLGPHKTFVKVPQETLAELMSAADFFACTGALKPYFMVEWEAMACNVPFIMLCGEREFRVSSRPRDEVFSRGWDRKTAKATWATYLSALGATW